MTPNEQLRALREMAGYLSLEAAPLLGMTPSRLSLMERGHVEVSRELLEEARQRFGPRIRQRFDLVAV